jgi:hypothetical protein
MTVLAFDDYIEEPTDGRSILDDLVEQEDRYAVERRADNSDKPFDTEGNPVRLALVKRAFEAMHRFGEASRLADLDERTFITDTIDMVSDGRVEPFAAAVFLQKVNNRAFTQAARELRRRDRPMHAERDGQLQPDQGVADAVKAELMLLGLVDPARGTEGEDADALMTCDAHAVEEEMILLNATLQMVHEQLMAIANPWTKADYEGLPMWTVSVGERFVGIGSFEDALRVYNAREDAKRNAAAEERQAKPRAKLADLRKMLG